MLLQILKRLKCCCVVETLIFCCFGKVGGGFRGGGGGGGGVGWSGMVGGYAWAVRGTVDLMVILGGRDRALGGAGGERGGRS